MPAPIGTGRQAVFSPLDDGAGRSEAVVRRLGSAIALGLIADGEQLPAEAELAASLGVATVTVREALSDLRRRGLVETRRGRAGGSFIRLSEPALSALSTSRVQERGSADLRELGEFHAAVAGAAAGLAAARASDSEINRLAKTLVTLEQASGAVARRRIEGRYYIEMAAAAQSVRLTREEIELQSELAELQLFPAQDADWSRMTVERHRAVVTAIEARDAALARRLTEEWIETRTVAMIEVHLALIAASGEVPGGDAVTPPGPAAVMPDDGSFPAAPAAPAGDAAAAELLVERIFSAVGDIRERLLSGLTGASGQREQLQPRHLADLRPQMIAILDAHRDIVVGMGLIVAPGVLPNERRRLEWWHYPLGREHPSALQVDLNPESLGFYDYETAAWFSVPRASGRRHIVGPYVDAHGTDRYLLTFTSPVVVGGTFLGVVGADVPVSRFERHLLGAWGKHDRGAVVGEIVDKVAIVTTQGRVVVSNHADALSGDLLTDAVPESTIRIDLDDMPWQLHQSAR